MLIFKLHDYDNTDDGSYYSTIISLIQDPGNLTEFLALRRIHRNFKTVFLSKIEIFFQKSDQLAASRILARNRSEG